jgi:hypothetical protein
MLPESFWRGRRLWSAVRLGVPAGVTYGLLMFATGGRPANAIFSGLIFAALFGTATAITEWRNWPGATSLARGDRVEVARAVRRGERVAEPRLASAVLGYGHAVRKSLKWGERWGWLLWVFAAISLGFAVANTVSGSLRHVVVWWALFVCFVGFMVWLPRKRARVLAQVSRAEARATELQEH